MFCHLPVFIRLLPQDNTSGVPRVETFSSPLTIEKFFKHHYTFRSELAPSGAIALTLTCLESIFQSGWGAAMITFHLFLFICCGRTVWLKIPVEIRTISAFPS